MKPGRPRSLQGMFALLCIVVGSVVGTSFGQDDQPAPEPGFKVKKVDTKIIDALGDFNRYSDKKAWELAFKAIQPLADVDASGMMPTKDGFWIPARQSVMRSFLALSDEGRDAYRLFYDAKAKQLLDEATVHPESSDDDVSALRKLVELYFITSSGQAAADRLGDDLFEAGDYGGAEQAWGEIVDQQASSDLNIPRIQTKRAIAMIRGKQVDRAEQIVGWLKVHAGDAKTVIGGKEVSVVGYLEGMIGEAGATEATTGPTNGGVASAKPHEATQSTGGGVASAKPQAAELPAASLSEKETPRWYFKYLDQQVSDQISSMIRNYGWQYMMGDLLSFVPNAAADSKHAYVNWLGIVYGLDARTGKLLWRTDKPSDIGGNVQQFIQFMPDPKRYTVTPAGDKVLVERIPPKRMNYQEPYRLQALDAQTGKQVWSSESGSLSNDDFSCLPIVEGDTVYAVGASRGGTEMQLIALALSNGKMQWNVSLGQAAAGNNWRGEPALPVFNLLAIGSNVFVLTNNGALLCVNVADRRLMWSFATGEVADVSNSGWWGGGEAPQRIQTPCAMVERDNVIYFKERDAETMFAVDVAGPSLKWKRPVASYETIAGIDSSRVYTVGCDIGGIDQTSHALMWSTHLPVTTGNFQPLMSGGSIFMFIGRGIYQLNSDGGDIQRIFRGYDRDSGGGRIFQTADGLITVSNEAVTAYPNGSGGQKLQ